MSSSNPVDYKTALQQRGLKATEARLQVMEEICSYDNAYPYSRLPERFPTMDRVTLYRTIQALQEKGLIHQAKKESDETYYASCSTSCSSSKHMHQHIHFKCLQCQTVHCLDLPVVFKPEIPGYTFNTLDLQATGTCKHCSS